MRNIYRVLACQYDPLGYILPYTTRAKVLVQALWNKKRGWDDIIEENGKIGLYVNGIRALNFCNNHEKPGQYSPTYPGGGTDEELRKSLFCAHVAVTSLPAPDQFTTWADLVQSAYQSVHGAATPSMSATQHMDTVILLLKQAQQDGFPDEVHALQKREGNKLQQQLKLFVT
ncbi:uncharacterized protein LOC114458488 [Tachysurus ichikawai]